MLAPVRCPAGARNLRMDTDRDLLPKPAAPTDAVRTSGTRPQWLQPGWRWILAAFGLLVLLPEFWFALDRVLASNQVLRGVWVGGVALSGLDRSQVTRAIVQLDGRLREVPLQLRIGSQLLELRPEQIGLKLDVDQTVEVAFCAGRTGPVVDQMLWWARRWFSPLHLDARTRVDPQALECRLSEWEATAIVNPPFEGGMQVRGGVLQADYPRSGFMIDRARARRSLVDSLARGSRTVIQLPLLKVNPKLDRASVDRALAAARRLTAGPVQLVTSAGQSSLRLDAKALVAALRTRVASAEPRGLRLFLDEASIDQQLKSARQRLEREPRSASFVVDQADRIRIAAGAPGIRLDARSIAAAVLRAAHSPERVGQLPLDRSPPPPLTTEAATALKITKLVSSFTTHHPCCRPRVKNIQRIAELVDGTIVEPGETLSINRLIGPRTRQKGFVSAPTIENGEMVDTVGGGISQFATTLFNAVFHGGYDIIERQPHTYYFPRYPMGHEATLSYPKPDLVFRNDTDAGLLIKCEYGKTFIRVRIYGDNGGRKVRAKVSRKRNIKQPPVELLPNPRLEPDEEKVANGGTLGWTVVVSRLLTYPDGTTKEEKRKVVYEPRVRQLEVHPCRIPEGENGYTGEECPIPDEAEAEEADQEASDASDHDAVQSDQPTRP